MADMPPAGQGGGGAPPAPTGAPHDNFFTRQVFGFPVWLWGGIIVVGVGLALYMRKRQQNASNQTGTGTQTTTSGAANLPDTIDPLTGVPYNIESAINPQTGLPAYYGTGNSSPVSSNPGPSGGPVSSGSTGNPPPVLAGSTGNALTGTMSVTGYGNPIVQSAAPGASQTSQPPVSTAPLSPPAQYVTVSQWTANNTPWNSTLGGIASHQGLALSRLEALNPGIANPNLIYPGQKVRVA